MAAQRFSDLRMTSQLVTAKTSQGPAPFSTLRLAGARLSTLRGVAALEGAVPLLSVASAAMFAREAQQPCRTGSRIPAACTIRRSRLRSPGFVR